MAYGIYPRLQLHLQSQKLSFLMITWSSLCYYIMCIFPEVQPLQVVLGPKSDLEQQNGLPISEHQAQVTTNIYLTFNRLSYKPKKALSTKNRQMAELSSQASQPHLQPKLTTL